MKDESRIKTDFPESWVAEVHERPLCRFLQIQLRHHKQGAASARMRLGEHVVEEDGVVSEGALMTLGGWTAQLAILSLVGQGRAIVPLEHRISLLQPARSGDVIAKARVEHMRARLAHCSYRVVDQEGELIAVGGFLADVLPREQVNIVQERSQNSQAAMEEMTWAKEEDGDASSLDVTSFIEERERKDTHEIPKVSVHSSPTLDEELRSLVGGASGIQEEHTHQDESLASEKVSGSALSSIERTEKLSSPEPQTLLPDIEEDEDSLDETVLSSVEALSHGALHETKLSSSRAPTLEWAAPQLAGSFASLPANAPDESRRTGAYGALPVEPAHPFHSTPEEDTEKFAHSIQIGNEELHSSFEDHQDTGEFDAPPHHPGMESFSNFAGSEDTEKFAKPIDPEGTEQFAKSNSPDDTQRMEVEPAPRATERLAQLSWIAAELERLPKKSSRSLLDHTMVARAEPESPPEAPKSLPIEADFFDDDPSPSGGR